MGVYTVDVNRRALLRYFLGAGVSFAHWPAIASNKTNFDSSPFKLGVACGSPAADGFVLWTKLVDEQLRSSGLPQDVQWELFQDSDLSVPITKGVATAIAPMGYAVHVEVKGLESDKVYFYRFRCGKHSSDVGRARSLPASGQQRGHVRLAFASCQRWEDGYYAAYNQMLADDPDFVVFLGDYIYENQVKPGKHVIRGHSLRTARTLEDYRARYELHRSDSALRRMHASCPWIVTWDDHEVSNNYGGLVIPGQQAGSDARRRAAYQAYYEHMPLRAEALLAGLEHQSSVGFLRVYNSFEFGTLLRMFVLDDRQYRSPPLCTKKDRGGSECASQEEATRSLLGQQQELWLRDQFQRSSRDSVRWNFIAQQTRFTPANYQKGFAKGGNLDAWDGFPTSRTRLLRSLIDAQLKNVVFLGGDIHKYWVANVHSEPYDVHSAVVAAEYCGTSISSRSGAQRSKDIRQAGANPHCFFVDSQYRGYGLVDLYEDRLNVTLKAVKEPSDANSKVDVLAMFVTENGVPGVGQVLP